MMIAVIGKVSDKRLLVRMVKIEYNKTMKSISGQLGNFSVDQ